MVKGIRYANKTIWVFHSCFIAVLLMFAPFTCVAASNINDSVSYATNVLKGLDDKTEKNVAIRILTECAMSDNARAMNALGIAYMNGLGVLADSTQGLAWLEKAGEHGYAEAYHNAGMIYKDGRNGVRQNFTRAVEMFSKGVAAKSIMCHYDLGYMLYKGLGCTQDYGKAADLFQIGVDADHSPCLYMLGLCYRNGYGVERDTTRASFLLNRAATLNYRAAMEELARNRAENSWNEMEAIVVQGMEVPASMPQIEPWITDVADLAGEYNGTLAIYDWSGHTVINELPLTVDMRCNGDTIQGIWREGADTVSFTATVTDCGSLKFHKSTIRKWDRYTDGATVLYRFQNADMCLENGMFIGSLRLYSVANKEPERPMYICLSKKTPTDSASASSSHLNAYPNPFSSKINLSFELERPENNCYIGLYSQSGICTFSASLGRLSSGSHTFVISPNLPDGLYVMRVTAGDCRYQTIVMKKRNAP